MLCRCGGSPSAAAFSCGFPLGGGAATSNPDRDHGALLDPFGAHVHTAEPTAAATNTGWEKLQHSAVLIALKTPWHQGSGICEVDRTFRGTNSPQAALAIGGVAGDPPGPCSCANRRKPRTGPEA